MTNKIKDMSVVSILDHFKQNFQLWLSGHWQKCIQRFVNVEKIVYLKSKGKWNLPEHESFTHFRCRVVRRTCTVSTLPLLDVRAWCQRKPLCYPWGRLSYCWGCLICWRCPYFGKMSRWVASNCAETSWCRKNIRMGELGPRFSNGLKHVMF